ncbi:MAG: YihY/virulence factor BrkB family protein [Usitatibacter sp.]
MSIKEVATFAWCTLKAFKANQGLLLAGAVAYYALLSIIPMLILIVMGLSYFVPEVELVEAITRYLEWIAPGQGAALGEDLLKFLTHREVLGWVLLATMLFFSSLAFTVLENSMSVIFVHRVAVRRRRYIISALMPYGYILSLTVGVLLVTLVTVGLQAMGERSVVMFGRTWGLGGLSAALLYLLGVAGEIFIITSIYMVMPVGRISLRRALLGGVTAALLWELTRHILLWYFTTLSRVGEVYGSFTTAIVVLFSLELAATLLLFGGQVIAEYERMEREGKKAREAEPQPMRTD